MREYTPERNLTCASGAERWVGCNTRLGLMLTFDSHSVTLALWLGIVGFTLESDRTNAPMPTAKRHSLVERHSQDIKITIQVLSRKPRLKPMRNCRTTKINQELQRVLIQRPAPHDQLLHPPKDQARCLQATISLPFQTCLDKARILVTCRMAIYPPICAGQTSNKVLALCPAVPLLHCLAMGTRIIGLP